MEIDNDLTSQPEVSPIEPNEIFQEEYPKLVDRYKAMLVDGLVIFLGIILAGIIFSFFENAPGYIRGSAFILIVFLYEPIFVSFLGATFGHKSFGLMVKSNLDRNKKVFFPLALIRSMLKLILGWLSFITMISDKQKRAIHDYASGSIVLYAKK
jgi:uncharacterized RDD family membrane protein YckC